MKCVRLAIAVAVACNDLVFAARLVESPVTRVVDLLQKMQTQIEEDGKSEQASYDKFSCWCEDTLSEKAEEITKAKDKLEELENSIVKNKGFLGSNGADISQLRKDIAENVASQKEATTVRKKENSAYDEEKQESEQCIGALEAAIKVLSTAGTGKKGFLETFQQAQLLSVVSGMRGVLKAPIAKHSMSHTDLQVVQQFVDQPEDFLKHSGMSAAQVGNNPFGDYAPQSTQIQGILKSMYDSFTADLEKDNAEEAEKQKSFEELMATKKKELTTMESSLQTSEVDEAEKTKKVADDKEMRDETADRLEAHEETFTHTKEICSDKAKQWAQRTRLRSQELAGIVKAIEILTSDDAKEKFKAAESFLQMPPKNSTGRETAYKQLKSMASRFKSLPLAQIAVSLKMGGHFDDVIKMIDDMIAVLREEAQDDIAHRDRCEDKQNANKNSKADYEHEIDKAKKEIEVLEQSIKDKDAEIQSIEKDMEKTKASMQEMTELRTKETEDFKKNVKDDEDAIKVLEEAKREIAAYYKNNFLQLPPTPSSGTKNVKLSAAEPKPETNWDAEGGNYKGYGQGATGIIAILDLITENLEQEIKDARQDEIDAQVDYEKDMSSLTASVRASEKAKLKAEVEKGELETKKADTEQYKDDNEKNLKDEEALSDAIAADCDWVESHFEKRASARKTEMDALVEAKDFLAGVGTDSDLSLPE